MTRPAPDRGIDWCRLLTVVAIIGVVLVLFTACAPTWHWMHASKNSVDFDRDFYECKIHGFEVADTFGAAGNPMIAAQHANECMKLRGWYQVEGAPQ